MKLDWILVTAAVVFLISCGSDRAQVFPEPYSPTPTVISTPDSSPSPTPTPTPVPTPIPGALPMNAPKGYEWVLGVWEGEFKWQWDSEEQYISTAQLIIGWDDKGPVLIVRSGGIMYFNPYKPPQIIGGWWFKRPTCSDFEPSVAKDTLRKAFPSLTSLTEDELEELVKSYIESNRVLIRGALVSPWGIEVSIPEDQKPAHYLTIVRYQLQDNRLVIVAAPAVPKGTELAEELVQQVDYGWQGTIPTAETVGMDGEYIWVPAFSVVIDLRPDHSGVYRLPSYEAEPLFMVAPPKFPDGVTWVGQAHLKKVSDVPTYIVSCN